MKKDNWHTRKSLIHIIVDTCERSIYTRNISLLTENILFLGVTFTNITLVNRRKRQLESRRVSVKRKKKNSIDISSGHGGVIAFGSPIRLVGVSLKNLARLARRVSTQPRRRSVEFRAVVARG